MLSLWDKAMFQLKDFKYIWILSMNKGKNGFGDQYGNWCHICSDLYTLLVCCGEEKAELKSKALILPVDIHY